MFTVREVRCLHQKASNPSRERLDYPRLQKQPRRQIVANVAKYWKTRNRTFCHSFYSCCYKMRNTYLEEAVCALWAKLIYMTDSNIRFSQKSIKRIKNQIKLFKVRQSPALQRTLLQIDLLGIQIWSDIFEFAGCFYIFEYA